MLRGLLLSAALLAQAGPPVGVGSTPHPNKTPAQLEGVGVTERLGATVPLDARVRDHRGATTTLGELLSHDRPTILTFNYSDCPMLCSLQLNGLVTSLADVGWTLGEDYDAITVSIDPSESPASAARTRDRYLDDLRRGAKQAPSADAWPFVVADRATLETITESVGFGYRLNPENGEWLHTATLVLLSPDERVSRYLYGVRYSPQTVRLSLAEAGEGERVSTVDRALLYCFQFDPTRGTYTPVVANVMRAGGAATATLLLVVVIGAMRRRRHTARREDT